MMKRDEQFELQSIAALSEIAKEVIDVDPAHAGDSLSLPSWMSFKMDRLPLDDWMQANLGSYRIIKPRRAGDAWRGSSLSDVCPREEVLCSLLEIEREEYISPDLKLIFAVGTAFHESIQQDIFSPIIVGSWRCKGCGKVFGSSDELRTRPAKCDGRVWLGDDRWEECPNKNYAEDVVGDWHLPGFDYKEIDLNVDHPFKFYSHPDGFIWRGNGPVPDVVDHKDPSLELIEIKSAGKTAINGTASHPGVKLQPLPDHELQIQLYLNLTGVDRGEIVYIDKSGYGVHSSIYSHTVRRDPAFAEKYIFSWIREVEEGLVAGSEKGCRRVCKSAKSHRAKKCLVAEQCWKK